MAEVVLMKVAGGMLAPADEPSREIVEKWRLGQGVKCKATRKRNLQHHRKFMALVEIVRQNSEVYDTKPKALTAVKLAVGHVEWVANPHTGALVPVPKSIAFDAMDQDAFNLFYDDAVNAVLKHLLPTMNRVSLDSAINMVIGF